jgi:hypothetical protein
VRVQVENPWYERIQVHCAVQLDRDVAVGQALARLNRSIREWISPWSPGGHTAHFGWSLRDQEVQAWLQGREGVRSVGRFSLVRLASRPGHLFRIDDSDDASDADDLPGELRGLLPWSIAVPFGHHLLEAVEERLGSAPDPTGLGELEIGATFVISGATHP